MGSNPIAVTKSFSIINCFHKVGLIVELYFGVHYKDKLDWSFITLIYDFWFYIDKCLFPGSAKMKTAQWLRALVYCCYCCLWIYFWSHIFLLIFFGIICVSLQYLLLFSLWSQLIKYYHDHSLTFLKLLFRSFCFLSICHAIR